MACRVRAKSSASQGEWSQAPRTRVETTQPLFARRAAANIQTDEDLVISGSGDLLSRNPQSSITKSTIHQITNPLPLSPPLVSPATRPLFRILLPTLRQRQSPGSYRSHSPRF